MTTTYFDRDAYCFRVLPTCRWGETFSDDPGLPCDFPRGIEEYKHLCTYALVGADGRTVESVAFFDSIPFSAFCYFHRAQAERFSIKRPSPCPETQWAEHLASESPTAKLALAMKPLIDEHALEWRPGAVIPPPPGTHIDIDAPLGWPSPYIFWMFVAVIVIAALAALLDLL
jgi:hypothetical protein